MAYLSNLANKGLPVGSIKSTLINATNTNNINSNYEVLETDGTWIISNAVYLKSDYKELFQAIGYVAAERLAPFSTNTFTSLIYFNNSKYWVWSSVFGTMDSDGVFTALTRNSLTDVISPSYMVIPNADDVYARQFILYANNLYIGGQISNLTATYQTNVIQTSTDLITWNDATTPDSVSDIRKIKYTSGGYLAAAGTNLWKSTNGSVWTGSDVGLSNIIDCDYNPTDGYYIAVSSSGSKITTDLVTWNDTDLTEAFSVPNVISVDSTLQKFVGLTSYGHLLKGNYYYGPNQYMAYQTFTTPTTTTWTVPTGVSEIVVICVGGGGSGAAYSSYAGGGGGGGLGWSILSVTEGQTYDVTVGAGGAKLLTMSTSSGNSGGDTIFSLSGTPIVAGYGGEGGKQGLNARANGGGFLGDNGGNGGYSLANSSYSSGGGGAGGYYGDGGSSYSTTSGTTNPAVGSGGGGAGAKSGSGDTAGSGGGVGIYGPGADGVGGNYGGADGNGGTGGSGGGDATQGSGNFYSAANLSTPGEFGGGAGGTDITYAEQSDGGGGAMFIGYIKYAGPPTSPDDPIVSLNWQDGGTGLSSSKLNIITDKFKGVSRGNGKTVFGKNTSSYMTFQVLDDATGEIYDVKASDIDTPVYSNDSYTAYHEGSYGNGYYCMPWTLNNVYYSTDTITWSRATSVPYSIHGITSIYDSYYQRFYVAGAGGRIYHTTDFITWTQATNAYTGTVLQLKSNGLGNIMAIHLNGYVTYSANGTSFVYSSPNRPYTSNIAENFYYDTDKSQFVINGGNKCWYSSTGATLTEVQPSDTGYLNNITSTFITKGGLIYDGTNSYVLVGNNINQIYYSTDNKTTWKPAKTNNLPTINATLIIATYYDSVNNRFVIVMNNGFYVSSDGQNWKFTISVYGSLDNSQLEINQTGDYILYHKYGISYSTDQGKYWSDYGVNRNYSPISYPSNQNIIPKYDTTKYLIAQDDNGFIMSTDLEDFTIYNTNIRSADGLPIVDIADIIPTSTTSAIGYTRHYSPKASNATNEIQINTSSYDTAYYGYEPIIADKDNTSGTMYISKANNRLFAGSSAGDFVTSTDGAVWHRIQHSIYTDVKNVVYKNNKYYALSSNSISRSTDGITWNSSNGFSADTYIANNGSQCLFGCVSGLLRYNSNNPKSPKLMSTGPDYISSANGKFFTYYNNRICVSDDGDYWTASNQISDIWNIYSGIKYLNNKYYFALDNAVAYPTFAYSTDAINWEVGIVNAATSTTEINIIDYGNSVYIAGQSGTVMYYSTDAVSWSSTTTVSSTKYSSVFAFNKFFVACSGGYILSSSDGITWDNIRPVTTNFYRIEYINNLLIAIGVNNILYSSDGVNWNIVNLEMVNTSWYGITYYDGKYILSGQNGYILTSTDLTTWDYSNCVYFGGTFPALPNIEYGNGVYVTWNDNTDKILTSTDDVTWSISSKPNPNNINALAFGNNTFVCGYSGYSTNNIIYRSTNGVDWTPCEIDPLYTYAVNDIKFGGGYFVYTKDNGYGYSTDAITWTFIELSNCLYKRVEYLEEESKFYFSSNTTTGDYGGSKTTLDISQMGYSSSYNVDTEFYLPSITKSSENTYEHFGVVGEGKVEFLAVLTSTGLKLYPWSKDTGFGTVQEPSYAVFTPYSSYPKVKVSDDGRVIFCCSTAAVYAFVIDENGFTGEYYVQSTSYTNSSVAKLSPNGKFVAVGAASYLQIYSFQLGVGFTYLTQAGNGAQIYDLDWHPDSNAIVCASNVSYYVRQFGIDPQSGAITGPWNSANGSSAVTTSVNYDRNNNKFYATYTTSVNNNLVAFTYTSPSATSSISSTAYMPSVIPYNSAISTNLTSNKIALALNSGSYITTRSIPSVGTSYGSPLPTPESSCYGVSFNYDEDVIFYVTAGANGTIGAYDFVDNLWVSKYTSITATSTTYDCVNCAVSIGLNPNYISNVQEQVYVKARN